MAQTRDRRRKVKQKKARARRAKVVRTAARVAVGASVAAVPLVGGPGVPAEPAAAYTGRAATMNICSAACHIQGNDKYRNFWGHTYLRNSVFNQGANSPWTIGATEVCGLSHLYLDGQFTSHAGDFFQTLSYHASCSGNFGDSLYTVGADIGSATQFKFSAGSYDSGQVPAEARSIGCQAKAGFGFNWDACVVHIATNNIADPVQQSNEARYVTSARVPELIVSGDFNLQPTANTPWPVSWEADGSLFPTASLETVYDYAVENKIDYNYAPTAWFPASSGATSCGTYQSRFDTSQYSDHCYLNATFSN
ncbi:MAG TPA: hypothetical protein VK507_22100 [Iamia sp.]|nr:hypothetical protein [Iamia sp.]